MAKTKRRKERTKTGAASRIAKFKEKYGDVVTLIQDVDRKPDSPTRWKTDYTRMIFWLALAGLTEQEMANVIGISLPGFALWKRNHPDFLAALKAGKEEAVGEAANYLLRAGIGFEHQAEKLIPNRVKEYDSVTGKVIREYTEIMRVPYVKKYPPNVTALTKFLAAHKPEVWGDRSEVNHTGTVTHEMDYSKLTKKQLKLLQKLQQTTKIAIENE